MRLTIPLYVEKRVEGERSVHAIRPLFRAEPEEKGESLGRVMARLQRKLRQEADELARKMSHRELSRWAFAPANIQEKRLSLTLDLRKRQAKADFLFALFASPEGDGRAAFTPSLPNLWFLVRRGEDLKRRAEDVISHWFRDLERERGEDAPQPESFGVQKAAWLASVELDVSAAQKKPEPCKFLAFGAEPETLDGASELNRVGHCLDWLHPAELERARFREDELAELRPLFEGADRRPILLVGPRGAGKTALVHESVFRHVEERQKSKRDRSKRQTWHISPQRLVSGMSYVGQWENRLLAILDEAKKREHVLYFDDLIGLFRAGATGKQGAMNVAAAVKPRIERREVRVLGEATPEAFRALRELDRGFADLFHVVRARGMPEAEAVRVLIGLSRDLEGRFGCRFAMDALPCALDLRRRHMKGEALPGGAASFLRKLAVKFRGADIGRADALREFEAKSGLSIGFLDDRQKLARSEVVQALRSRVIGQPEAVEAAADAVVLAKARLSDPGRPMAAFLFLGPTGVGKTELAKALAAWLYGAEERLVRFDMNEFADPWAAARLAGSPEEPAGLLASAVRRQPFCVVLLDEIEKAHPDVFDMLLQALGEGRLTDALGRTADFSNAIVILTSNLGARDAEREVGFQRADERESRGYAEAAEKFFKPEFFNRLDRVVPFRRLGRAEMRGIVELLFREALSREGLARRRVLLEAPPETMDRVAEAGFDPKFGARALKRTVERLLMRPAAIRLASRTDTAPTVVSLWPARGGAVADVQPLDPAPLSEPPDLGDSKAALARLDKVLDGIAASLEGLRPSGAVSAGAIQDRHVHYYDLSERLEDLRQAAELLRDGAETKRAPKISVARGRFQPKRYRVDRWTEDPHRAELFAVQDIRSYLSEAFKSAEAKPEELRDRLEAALREAALLRLMAREATSDGAGGRALLVMRLLGSRSKECAPPTNLHPRMFKEALGLEAVHAKGDPLDASCEAVFWAVSGAGALPLARLEEGVHLLNGPAGEMSAIHLRAEEIRPGEEPADAAERLERERAAWKERLAAGDAPPEADPWRPGALLRLLDAEGVSLDLRSGRMVKGMPSPEDMAGFALSQLPLPGGKG